jgi:class 3 adenylate cyclase
MTNLPSGTVTFLFSDIEGSTALLKVLGNDRYAHLLADHRRIVRRAFEGRNGHEIDTQGDAFFYTFARARDAVAAAVTVLRALASTEWPGGARVLVRIGLHTGEPAVGDEGYTGLDVVRAARIAAVTRGGQVLMSESTRVLVGEDLPDGVSARSIGTQRLKDIDRPEPLHELVVEDLEVSLVEAESERRDEPSEDRGDRYQQLADRARRSIEDRVYAQLERTFRKIEADPPPRSDEDRD